MLLQDLIKPESVACNVEARSKKHCLELLAGLLARPEPLLPADAVFARLVERERLGCTSLTQGTAFPHCRLSGVEDARGALIRLAAPLEFDAIDGEMVDLVVGLIVPEVLEDAHYRAIDRITALLTDEPLLGRLRAARSDAELYRALMTAEPGPRFRTGGARGG